MKTRHSYLLIKNLKALHFRDALDLFTENLVNKGNSVLHTRSKCGGTVE